MSQTSLGGCRRGLIHLCHGHLQAPDVTEPRGTRRRRGWFLEARPAAAGGPAFEGFPGSPWRPPSVPHVIPDYPPAQAWLCKVLGYLEGLPRGAGPGRYRRWDHQTRVQLSAGLADPRGSSPRTTGPRPRGTGGLSPGRPSTIAESGPLGPRGYAARSVPLYGRR